MGQYALKMALKFLLKKVHFLDIITSDSIFYRFSFLFSTENTRLKYLKHLTISDKREIIRYHNSQSSENLSATVRWVQQEFMRPSFNRASLRNILFKKEEIMSWSVARASHMVRSSQLSGNYPKAETAWAISVRELRALGFPYTRELINDHWVCYTILDHSILPFLKIFL
jgi:hypothetical protein